jgi:hypothetical protein
MECGRASKAAGIVLIVLSGVLWLALPGIPFLPLTGAGKGGIAAVVLIIAEIFFWGGCALVGAQLFKRWRPKSRFGAWFRRLFVAKRDNRA